MMTLNMSAEQFAKAVLAVRPYFDVAHVVRTGDVPGGASPPLHQYLDGSIQADTEPAFWFRDADYRAMYPEVDRFGLAPLLHLVLTGLDRGYAGSQDWASFGFTAADAAEPVFPKTADPDAVALLIDLVSPGHLVRHGGPAFLRCDAVAAAYLSEPAGLAAPVTPYLFESYYRAKADLAAGEDALLHFVTVGVNEGLSPHPLLDFAFIREQLPAHLAHSTNLQLLRLFATGQLDVATHMLLSPRHLGRQLERDVSGLEAFLLFADPETSVALDPHSLFDVAYYGARHDLAHANQLIDYLLARPVIGRPHPLFSPEYLSRMGIDGDASEPLLLRYLRTWSRFEFEPSLFVDLKFLNHSLNRMGVAVDTDPLSASLGNDNDLDEPSLHPHVDPRVIRYCFDDLIGDAALTASAKVSRALGALTVPPKIAQTDGPVELSVIVLNFRKPVYTVLCLLAAIHALRDWRFEIVMIENGGEYSDYEEMLRIFQDDPRIRFHKMDRNKFFGEGNNIAIDLVRGERVMFLNNDCFLHNSFGTRLREVLKPGVDVLGSLLLFPDKKIQEFGGYISDCGAVIQRAKHLPVDLLPDPIEQIEEVEYVSAACLVMSRAALDVVRGFDPAFEPFYYEDTDLCRRLIAAGYKIWVTAELRAMHLENVSTKEFLGDGFHPLIAKNRLFFSRRWLKNRGQGVLIGGSDGVPPATAGDQRPRALVVTPFDLRAGGGERYLLSAARTLAQTHAVTIATPMITSRARLLFALHALGIEPFAFELKTFNDVLASRNDFAVSFVMGNEIVPPFPAIARSNIYHLQFPFPWRNVGATAFAKVTGFDVIAVNSAFTQGWTRRRLGEVGLGGAVPVEVLFPPVRRMAEPHRQAAKGPLRLITVGRIFVGGHSKRQDIFLDILEAARKQGAEVEGVIIGSVSESPGSQDYYEKIARRAEAMKGVELIVEASRIELERELAAADIYIHCAGYQVLDQMSPERAEHFGISIIEAMQVGAYPLVYDLGGPAEIVQTTGFGTVYATVAQAAGFVTEFERSSDRRMPAGALEPFLEDAFSERLAQMVSRLEDAAAAPASRAATGR